MLMVYNDHKRAHTTMRVLSEQDAKDLAYAAASHGHDAFYRVFGPQGFITAWSVLNGQVKEHRDVTIPLEHW